jgi:D-3-phosphoglycerate dehydrogenase / 2-oxoglutarate reductase
VIEALRWGQSAYESDLDIAREQAAFLKEGVRLHTTVEAHPDLSTVEILVVNSGVQVTAARMERTPCLRMVLTTTSGSDHIDLAAAQDRGITVGRCPLARRDAVVDTALAMGLSLLRQLPSLNDQARAGIWARSELPARNPQCISGARVGIVGAGVIGKLAIQKWTALGASVQFFDPALQGGVDLETLISHSDIVSLHCSLTPQSQGMMNAQRLALMPKGSILLNTARGACVEIAALEQATHLGGIGLDVFASEPPIQLAALAQRNNVLLSPHAAGFHPEMAKIVCSELVASLRAWQANERLPAQLT